MKFECLNKEDLQALTGFKRRSEQKAWLRRAGVPYFERANGDPVVLPQSLQDALIEQMAATAKLTAEIDPMTPNFAWLHDSEPCKH